VLGVKAFIQNVPAIRIGGQLTKSPYQYVMRSANIDELYQWAPRIEQKLRGLPALIDCPSDLQITRPQVTVRDRAREGVRARRVARSRSRWRSTTPTARARCRPSTPRPTSTG
jgi:HAE1 family hydrophobic/amphiphilic exporter-1